MQLDINSIIQNDLVEITNLLGNVYVQSSWFLLGHLNQKLEQFKDF